MVRGSEKVDVHDHAGRMGRALRHLRNHQGISESSKRKLLEYLEHPEDEGLSLARHVTHLVRLTRIAKVCSS